MQPRSARPAAAVLAALVVLAAAGLIAGSRGGDTPPEDVIRAYLAALRRGDAEQALRIAGEPESNEVTGAPEPDTSLLTAEALSGDWQVERIVRRYPWRSGPGAAVDVTLGTPDGRSADGRFWLVREAGRWSIEDPFVEVYIGTGLIDHVEINGVVRPAGGQSPYLLFPGVYRGWTGVAELFAGGQPTVLVALPNYTVDRLDPPGELSPAGNAAAQRAVNAYLDGCAESPDLQPLNCPFSGGEYDSVDADDEYYLDPSDLAWEIVAYPEVLVVLGGDGFGLVPRTEGTVRLTGTGTPSSDDEDDRESFSVECPIDVTTLYLRFNQAGDFEVDGGEAYRTC